MCINVSNNGRRSVRVVGNGTRLFPGESICFRFQHGVGGRVSIFLFMFVLLVWRSEASPAGFTYGGNVTVRVCQWGLLE